MTSMPRIGLTGFGDYAAGQGPQSVAVLRQHFIRGTSLNTGPGQVGARQMQAGHNGSGARLGSQRKRYDTSRDRRRGCPEEPPTRGVPSGPVEQTELLDALEDMKTRLSTMERLQRTQSEHSAENRRFAQEVSDRLDQHISQFNDHHQQFEVVRNNLYQAGANIEAQYVKSDAIRPTIGILPH